MVLGVVGTAFDGAAAAAAVSGGAFTAVAEQVATAVRPRPRRRRVQ
ncbi:hypothetical protein HMPREF9005_1523 [Actinomyces sp. oral taxon 178 str. F0338]|nr:hypothetical protein HMPREF9005_1523 [Actinomyces sp. oral taxon 178 str. F0338]